MARHLPEGLVFLLFAFRHYGYQWWPSVQQGLVYGASAAVCLLVLLAAPVRLRWPVKAWIAAEELLSAGCYSFKLAAPDWFKYEFQDEVCSQVVGFKIGAVGLVIVALLAYRMLTLARVDDGLNRKGSGK